MTWLESLILGVVEGVTEFLPISSTGHLVLTEHVLGLEKSAALDAFDMVIQGGAILAVLGIYRLRMVRVGKGLLGRDADGLQLALKLLVAFVPSAVAGLLVKDYVEAHLKTPGPVLLAVVGGAALIFWVVGSRRERKANEGLGVNDITYVHALLIGLAQCLALWPGTSRSLVTILAGLLLGVSALAATEFAFLLGVVTLGAVSVYKGCKYGGVMVHDLGALPLAIGMLASAISAFVAVKWFIHFLNRHGLAPFGWYRLALGIVLAAAIAGGWLAW